MDQQGRQPSDVTSGTQADSVQAKPRTKKALVRTILKQTKPPKGFIQSYFVFEQRRVSEDIGLLRLEGYDKNKLSWSGSLSVNVPQGKTYGADGRRLL